MGNIYFKAPFEDREEILALGAKWSKEQKMWEIPPTRWCEFSRTMQPLPAEEFLKWIAPREGLRGSAAPGHLYVDMIPFKCGFSNLRTIMKPEDWSALSREVSKAYDRQCAICMGRGSKHPVESHERWVFDVATKTQRLKCIQSLCPACHSATHYGFSHRNGKGDIARNQLKHVNFWDDEDVDNHLMRQYKKCNELNKTDWLLDMSWLIGKTNLPANVVQTIELLKNGSIKRP